MGPPAGSTWGWGVWGDRVAQDGGCGRAGGGGKQERPREGKETSSASAEKPATLGRSLEIWRLGMKLRGA